jgi:hypothetical protein
MSQSTLQILHPHTMTVQCSVNAVMPDNSTSPWLGGLRLDQFPGSSIGVRIAQAAHWLGADVLSPSAEAFVSPSPDPALAGYVSFTTKDMVDAAHGLGMTVKPWTVSLRFPSVHLH